MDLIEEGVNAMNPKGTTSENKDSLIYSEEELKLSWMRETRIRTFMQMELETCRDESK